MPAHYQRQTVHPQNTQANDPSLPLFLSPRNAGDSTNASTPLIGVHAVSVITNGTTLLQPTTFQAEAGQVVALRGENGSGKTTLLRALAGRIRPTVGAIRVGGQPVDERSSEFRGRVAAMIGLPPMALDLIVFDHLALVSSTWAASPKQVEAAVHRVLEEFQLTALATRYPYELSSGQTQLFGLALVFVRPFDVLLLDEPEQRLDPGRIELLANAMLARRAAGAAIIVATHSETLSEFTADLAVLLEVQA